VIDIDGVWNAEYRDTHDNEIREELHLKQFGWRIKGDVAYHIRRANGDSADKTSCIEGIFRNDLLCAYY
jgi:hypothetical protein